MANKFCSPFGNNRLCITQTYHAGSNNWAIDCNPKLTGTKAGDPVVAIADGKIGVTSLGAGAYCTLIVDNSPIKLFNVHTYQWLTAGTKVSKGQQIGVLAPEGISGEPIHLHLGLGKVSGNYPHIMDFFDRNIKVETRYNDIKADWFNSDGSFDWSKHKDLDYKTLQPVLPLLNVGQRLIFNEVMNLRDIDNNITDTISKGAVGEITLIDTYHDGYQWYGVRFLDRDGFVADTKFNEITDMPLTNINATIPEPTPEPIPEPIPEPTPEPPTPPTTNDTPEVAQSLLEIIIKFFTDLISKLLGKKSG